MKVKYEFGNRDVTKVEVSEEIGAMIIDFRCKKESGNRKECCHCCSMDAAACEAIEYGASNFTEKMFNGCEERGARVRKAFSHLSCVQQRRLLCWQAVCLSAGSQSARARTTTSSTRALKRPERNF